MNRHHPLIPNINISIDYDRRQGTHTAAGGYDNGTPPVPSNATGMRQQRRHHHPRDHILYDSDGLASSPPPPTSRFIHPPTHCVWAPEYCCSSRKTEQSRAPRFPPSLAPPPSSTPPGTVEGGTDANIPHTTTLRRWPVGQVRALREVLHRGTRGGGGARKQSLPPRIPLNPSEATPNPCDGRERGMYPVRGDTRCPFSLQWKPDL